MGVVQTRKFGSLELASYRTVLDLIVGKGQLHFLLCRHGKDVADRGLEPDLGSELGAVAIDFGEVEVKGGLLDAIELFEAHLEIVDSNVTVGVVADKGSSRGSGLLSGGADGGGDVRHSSQSRNDKFGLHVNNY